MTIKFLRDSPAGAVCALAGAACALAGAECALAGAVCALAGAVCALKGNMYILHHQSLENKDDQRQGKVSRKKTLAIISGCF